MSIDVKPNTALVTCRDAVAMSVGRAKNARYVSELPSRSSSFAMLLPTLRGDFHLGVGAGRQAEPALVGRFDEQDHVVSTEERMVDPRDQQVRFVQPDHRARLHVARLHRAAQGLNPPSMTCCAITFIVERSRMAVF